ncbi:hypothetical protein EA687_14710 [Acinetobacter baumannii]|nr:hypothetical protein [Acinetobacter baumannii]PPC43384.1 hypothetical protein AbaMCR54_01385 [Acinetobacter baumannii]PPC50163.1 hypothetical protein AbaHEU2_19815 [Acinetobacter baumannii]RQN75498.1 hypothetical protein EAH71_16900 [Acinetobacter baumannii]RSQ97265.1 hypothetical protein EA687_14710 [Acinetobacter baumannii]
MELYKYQKTYASKTPHEIEQIKFLGGHIPDPPEYSYAADSILSAFSTIARSRRYEQGIPLSLDQQAINVYAEHNDLPVAAHIFNDCIFALDNLFLEQCHKKISTKSKGK